MVACCTRRGSRRKREDVSNWYKVLSFTDVRVAQDNRLQALATFTPVWLSLYDISGLRSYEEIGRLAVAKYGKDLWSTASQGWDCNDLHTLASLGYAK
jgi:hypothetical protein